MTQIGSNFTPVADPTARITMDEVFLLYVDKFPEPGSAATTGTAEVFGVYASLELAQAAAEEQPDGPGPWSVDESECFWEAATPYGWVSIQKRAVQTS